MTVGFKKLHPLALLPQYAHLGDAGMDLCACEELTIPSGEYALVKTGLAIELPQNFEAQVRPRSGLALKYGITLLNSPGTIDQGYRGELGVVLINHGREPFVVTIGMRVAQLVIAPVLRVKVTELHELSTSIRGDNGFGSTGT